MRGIVTGASSGMGRDFVLKLDKNEKLDEIWVLARRADRLEELKKEVKTPLRVISCDLTKQESIDSYVALLEKEKPSSELLGRDITEEIIWPTGNDQSFCDAL